MKKSGRPSKTPKRLKDGYYMSITLNNRSKSIRLMRETYEQMKDAEKQYKDRNFKYLGQVKDHYWIDGDNKGSKTN
ncbi:MAG: hypothetical protein HN522_00780 [Flavobacteriales bacterium]|jgi:hypothetical protein|nr:hypothetical protein [Flavobacteriales bacterium]MBT5089657.1 hypothetical protein [Flavobacteriales bacterium]MBT5749974.1 hypothetical protein [Flavobacteriales bacterium]